VIDDTLLFQLLRVVRAGRGSIAPFLVEHGLHPGQELLLAQLWRQDGLTHAQLVAQLGVQAPTVTKAVQRLEKAGFVHREGGGGRGSQIYLTSKGADLREPVEQAWRQADDQITQRLSAEQHTDLAHLLSRLTNGAHEATGGDRGASTRAQNKGRLAGTPTRRG
jgi:DNA-binding MarR family transcriptional regulator